MACYSTSALHNFIQQCLNTTLSYLSRKNHPFKIHTHSHLLPSCGKLKVAIQHWMDQECPNTALTLLVVVVVQGLLNEMAFFDNHLMDSFVGSHCHLQQCLGWKELFSPVKGAITKPEDFGISKGPSSCTLEQSRAITLSKLL